MTKTRIGCVILIAIAFACSAPGRAEEREPIKTGLPLPRFVSLKADVVNARVGPGAEYQIAWVFRRAGMPVEVLEEYYTWRQVRDSDGGTGWVAAGLTSGRRTALVAPWAKNGPLFQIASSRGGANAVAQVEPGAIVDIVQCDGQDCEVYAGKQKGWAPQKNLWGVYPGEKVK
jgi:SH3-like domain-containing protein